MPVVTVESKDEHAVRGLPNEKPAPIDGDLDGLGTDLSSMGFNVTSWGG
jgi:hypothetical protein